ncbi:MAG: hypothetical protein ABWY00_10165 [Dongiaceae bacterium]
MKRFLLAVAAIAAIALNGCAQTSSYEPAATDDVPITQQVLDHFKRYQADIGTTHPGAFAVSLSGQRAFYTYCADVRCVSGSPYGLDAISHCEKNGDPCYLFAVSDRIRYKYHVIN